MLNKNPNTEMRVFESWAIRSSNVWKLEYYWFMHPLLDHSYAKYMNKHRLQEDGQLRTSNNWWNGWSTEVSLQSMVRHMEDLKALHAWLYVYKVLWFNGETTTVSIDPIEDLEWFGAAVTIEEVLNAIRFNTQSYLLEYLKNE